MADYDLGFRWALQVHLLDGTRLLEGRFMTHPIWLITAARATNDNPVAARKRRRPAPVSVDLDWAPPWIRYAERAAREGVSDGAPSRAARSQSPSDDDPWWYVGEPPGGGAAPPVR